MLIHLEQSYSSTATLLASFHTTSVSTRCYTQAHPSTQNRAHGCCARTRRQLYLQEESLAAIESSALRFHSLLFAGLAWINLISFSMTCVCERIVNLLNQGFALRSTHLVPRIIGCSLTAHSDGHIRLLVAVQPLL